MKVFLQGYLLAGTMTLAVLLALSAGAQNSNSQGDQVNSQNSPAYQRGYRMGMKDRQTNLEPSGYAQGGDTAERIAYRSGYRAGYCREEQGKTGYYTGAYHDYATPVLRNGYYGYNSPSAYCGNGGAHAVQHSGAPQEEQNRAEYGGGG